MNGKKSKSVNLLSTVDKPGDLFTIFYNWSFTVGKFLLILVQVLVLVVFGVRYYWDRINNDLTREINTQVGILAEPSMIEREYLYRRVHSFFEDLNKLEDSHEKNVRDIYTALDSIPEDFMLESFNFSDNTVSYNFIAPDLNRLREFENFLKRNPQHDQIAVRLEREQGSGEIGDIDTGVEVSLRYIILDETAD